MSVHDDMARLYQLSLRRANLGQTESLELMHLEVLCGRRCKCGDWFSDCDSLGLRDRPKPPGYPRLCEKCQPRGSAANSVIMDDVDHS